MALRPPRRLLAQAGPGDWAAIGRRWAHHLQDWADLGPHSHLLDVGCGPGRVALGLLDVIGPELRYDGFDVKRRTIRWCRRHIESAWPNARFRRVDLRNGTYNPRGRIDPDTVRFPYGDRTFDVVYLGSVFTHLLPTTVRHYLDEIARVLVPGGRCVATFFLMNEISRRATPTQPEIWFDHRGPEGTMLWKPERPEAAIAYEEDDVRAACAASGLRVIEPIRFGTWSGAVEHGASPQLQDTVVAER